jgi:hypothetical protein
MPAASLDLRDRYLGDVTSLRPACMHCRIHHVTFLVSGKAQSWRAAWLRCYPGSIVQVLHASLCTSILQGNMRHHQSHPLAFGRIIKNRFQYILLPMDHGQPSAALLLDDEPNYPVCLIRRNSCRHGENECMAWFVAFSFGVNVTGSNVCMLTKSSLRYR